MNRDILLITFDSYRSDYPMLTYSVGSLIAAMKHYNISVSHYPINVQQYLNISNENITTAVSKNISESISFFKKFDFIAIGVTRWSIEHTYSILELLHDYQGKVILGGYEITAIKGEDLVIEFPRVDFFIKGYAEKAMVKLIKNEYQNPPKVIKEELDLKYLFSPYSSGVINVLSRKIYWETKRGCSFACGFCEWGNANIGMVVLNQERLEKDIDIFSKTNIEEINILDGTFNIKNNYKELLEHLLKKTDAVITFQARFEALNDDFLLFCSENKKRLHLEFGLQTIHENEMEVIGRKNNIELITKRLNELNSLGIDYEVSIIYAIPGQTLETFIDTIEFLRIHNCKKIMAFPLQIPRNSELEEKRDEYKITFQRDNLNVHTVASSISFSVENRADMDRISESLNMNNQLFPIEDSNKQKIKNTKFQYEIKSKYLLENIHLFCKLIENQYITPTMSDISARYNHAEFLILLGESFELSTKSEKERLETCYLYSIGKKCFEFKNIHKKSKPFDIGNGVMSDFNCNKQNDLKPTKFFCKLVLGESGNVYIFRKVEVLQK